MYQVADPVTEEEGLHPWALDRPPLGVISTQRRPQLVRRRGRAYPIVTSPFPPPGGDIIPFNQSRAPRQPVGSSMLQGDSPPAHMVHRW